MSGDQILQLFAYLFPAVVTGAVAFYFFRLHTRNEDGRRRFCCTKTPKRTLCPSDYKHTSAWRSSWNVLL